MTDSDSRRWAACVQYDGRSYCGWQRQDHSPSVQEAVERAVSLVANESVQIHCAGRTDTGVHATGQIVHFDSSASRSERNWVLGVNANLPDDVALSWVTPVSNEFHARFSARSRTYRYFFLLSPFPVPHLRGMVNRIRDDSLDLEAMRQAFSSCHGEQDFSSFRGAGCQSNSPYRCVTQTLVEDLGAGLIELRVTANAFLLHMVRNLAGALLEVGRGNLSVDDFRRLLAIGDRRLAPATAAPDGLYLWKVEYPPTFALPPNPAWPLFPNRDHE